MNNVLIDKYVRLLDPLSVDLKLSIITALTESIRKGFESKPTDKEQLFEKLNGAWADVNDDLESIIYSSRTISDRDINFDI